MAFNAFLMGFYHENVVKFNLMDVSRHFNDDVCSSITYE